MMMIYARGGSGKTYLMTSVALGIGAGQWFTHAAEQGAVLICAFERPQDAEDRLAALREKLNVSRHARRPAQTRRQGSRQRYRRT